MNLTGHLLYIDITQICGLGCNFCMYADKHKGGSQMHLSQRSVENLAGLVNDSAVKRTCVSGEGEPLNNIETFHGILRTSRGGRSFEFITSGFLPHEQMRQFYATSDAILQGNRDRCTIRLSSDSYHVEKLRHRPHGFSLGYALQQNNSALSFSFRSVDTDRSFTRSYLLKEAAAAGGQGRIEERGPLQDALLLGGRSFAIDYKNHVHPGATVPQGYLDLHAYIGAIEQRSGKRFTLGSINPAPMGNGMDVTIKPDGSVLFYGIENIPVGNIHSDRLTWAMLATQVADTPAIRRLYTWPFADVIAPLAQDETMARLVKQTNNPYWLLKQLALHPGLLERIGAA